MTHALLSAEVAARFAATAIANIRCSFPQRVDRVQLQGQPLIAESLEHPAFHGSFDWHSCVHMHWLLVRLLGLFPKQAWAGEARQLLDERLTAKHLHAELEYFCRPGNLLFERPYGWAWLFKLLAAVRHLHGPPWQQALEPLAEELAQRFEKYLHQLSFPVRAGTHGNTAFAMLMALDLERPELSRLIRERALSWFGDDRDYPARYEPDGEDFLSGGLTEAALMSRLLDEQEFGHWWRSFQPDQVGWKHWQQPLRPASRTDGRLVHLAGLNLSRAWCLRLIASRLPSEANELKSMAQSHLNASLPHVTGEDFAGDHWLASFATLALAP